MTPAPPVKPKYTPKPPKQPSAPSPLSPARTPKKFGVEAWRGDDGEKVVIYGPSGVGKTTLAALAPNPIFIGIDDGARKIKHPVTGEDLQHVTGIETFQDVRDAVHQYELWRPGCTLVLDTATKLQELVDEHVIATIMAGDFNSRHKAENLESYGYGKGYKHSLDAYRLILSDLDALVRRGVNVVLLAQQSAQRISNSEGLDYIQDGPKLHHFNNASVRLDVMEWADHVLRVGYHEMAVVAPTPMLAKQGRGKVTGSAQRAIYTAPTGLHFVAKSRTIKVEGGAVSFESESDGTIWDIMFRRSDK